MQQITIGENEAGQRFDKMLTKYLNEAPKSFLYKMLRKKNITLNGKKATGNEKLKQGDSVTLFLSEETISKFSKTQFKCTNEALDIVYEDEHIILMNKPAGTLSQKASVTDESLVEHLITYLIKSGQLTRDELKTFRPSVCNRLDRNTSGLVAAGKSLPGLQELSRLFKDRSLGKFYLCLVSGIIKEPSHISGFLNKNSKTNQVHITHTEESCSVPIETAFIPVKSSQNVTLLKVHLITGKTHQIRAHLASIGHPILGDSKYGSPKTNECCRREYKLNHQLLHAYQLTFPLLEGALSSLSGKTFYADIPPLFDKIAKDKGVL